MHGLLMSRFLRCLAPPVFLLTGCANIVHQSQIDGRLYTRVNINRFPVVIAAVDGVSTPSWQPIWITPEQHTLSVDAPPPRGFTQPVRKEIALDVKPCVRYHLGAQRINALTHAWELVIDHEEPVPGCSFLGARSTQIHGTTVSDHRVALHP
jgi:hypothetical protein